MKLSHSYTAYLFLFLLSAFTVNCQIILSYKFGSKAALEDYKLQNTVNGKENVCVHLADDVRSCGRRHLSTPAVSDTTGYVKCLTDLGLPDEFISEISTMTKYDFISPPHFEDAYERKLIKYVENIDQKYPATIDKEPKIEFNYSIDYLAFAILIGVGVAVYFINREKTIIDESAV